MNLNQGRMKNPKLIEPGVRYFLYNTLKNNHEKNIKYFTSIYNIKLFTIFIFFFGGFIYYKYKTMPEVLEKKAKKESVRQYLLQKMSNNTVNNKQSHSLITNLPRYKNDFELLHENYYNI